MFMRCFFLMILTFMFAVIQPAHSSTSNADEAVEKLLQAMNYDENLKSFLDSMKETILVNSPYIQKEIDVMVAREVGEDEAQKASAIYQENDFGPSRLYELFRYKLNLDRIFKEVMVPVYRDNYTTNEIEELTKFYQSELGQKTLKVDAIIGKTVSEQTRDIVQMTLNQAKEELAFELLKKLK